MRDGARPQGGVRPPCTFGRRLLRGKVSLGSMPRTRTSGAPRPTARRPVAAPESTPHAAAASPGGSGLARAVPRWHLVALMVNGIVGAGIFGLPSQVHALAGPWGLAAFVLCGAVVAAFALTFAEVASRFAL